MNGMQAALDRMKSRWHQHCMVCGSASDNGLHLEFVLQDDGTVAAVFDCHHAYQGYPHILHGGVVSSLLDGAMTNCLFAHGYTALTAELNVRFRHPVVTGKAAALRARIMQSRRPLHQLEAECLQGGEIMAIGSGKFLESHALCHGA
jgi:uncharacterized protein (TIGR00369 family)